MTAHHHHHHRPAHGPRLPDAGKTAHDAGLWLHHLGAHLAGFTPFAIAGGVVLVIVIAIARSRTPAVTAGEYPAFPAPAPRSSPPMAREWPAPPARASQGALRPILVLVGLSAGLGFALTKATEGAHTVIATAPRPIITVRPVITHAPAPVHHVVHQATHAAASHGLNITLIIVVAVIGFVVLGINSILRFSRGRGDE